MSEFATTLDIRHLEGSDPASFVVSLLDDGKGEAASAVPSPWQYPVRDRPKSNLMAELRWYLEEFLEYPFPPKPC